MKNAPASVCLLSLLLNLSAAFLVPDASAQIENVRWEALPDGPVSPIGRHDDVTFINENIGWVVNGGGQVYRTVDGGNSWDLLYDDDAHYWRSVAFANENRGWIGSITSTSETLFETYDGGYHWLNVTERMKSPPGGVCGIQALSDQVVYGVGAFFGGPWFVKTTDGGATWTSARLVSEAATLVDLYFKNENEGFAVGGTSPELRGDAVVLYTNDGGNTWSVVHRTDHGDGVAGEWAWKISFPTDLVGYVSIEYTGNSSSQSAKILKTIDGGQTWTEHFIPVLHEYSGLQGIGFVNKDLGWASGRGSSAVTTDGGQNWALLQNYSPDYHPDGQLDGATNRIFVVSPTLAFAVGRYTYRFDASNTGPVAVERPLTLETPRAFTFDEQFPNPFSASTTIGYTLNEDLDVRISVIDLLGRPVRRLQAGRQARGAYHITWDGTDEGGRHVSAGTYFFLMDIGNQYEMKQVVALTE